MGYDVNRFESRVSDEFICTICTDVLEDPLVTPSCEHVFCGECIKSWLTKGPLKATPSCPNDRQPATVEALRSPLRSFRNLLYGQSIRCSYEGCSEYVKLLNLADHEADCHYNPLNVEKEVNCRFKCGAKYKMQNADKHNCVVYLKKELKNAEEQTAKNAERIRQLEKENGKLTKKLYEERKKVEETKLSARNETELQKETNEYLTLKLEKTLEENDRLKGEAALAKRIGLQNGNTSISGSSTNKPTQRPKSVSPKDNRTQQVVTTSLSVDTAVLVDLQNSTEEEFSGLQIEGNSRLSNSKFYSNSNSNNHGTVRSTGSSSDSSSNVHLSNNRSENIVKNLQAIFNRFPSLPTFPMSKVASTSSPLPSPTATSFPASTTSASSPCSPPPPVPPKPPRPSQTPANQSSLHGQTNNNQNSNYANFDAILPYPTITGNGTGSTVSNNSPPSAEQLIRDLCKKQRVLQVMLMVNRRHFFPANEYYKAAATKRGAHAFPLAYEIRLLEILESYITGETRILDIGSGMGFLTVCLAHLAKTVIGVEHVRSLATKSAEIVTNHYGNLSEQGRVVFFNEDGRYGLQRLAPYDLILIEPIVRHAVPETIFRQLRPGGCLVAVVRTESKVAMYRFTLNEAKKVFRQTLIDDTSYLNAQHKDYLCDLKNQETVPFLNKLKSLQL